MYTIREMTCDAYINVDRKGCVYRLDEIYNSLEEISADSQIVTPNREIKLPRNIRNSRIGLYREDFFQ